MHAGFSHNPALTIALALAAGMVAQILARHLRVPGIVLLLASGVLLGPDVLGVVDPADLGRALTDLTGFAVAVILFEGGLGLRIQRIRAQSLPLRLLLSLGVVITSVGGALAVKLVLGWDWLPSVLFGTLVIVTGPTVVTPLLRRIRAKRSLETILETEGVLIDAVGAVVAVVALEIALAPGGAAAAHELAGVPLSLLGGALFGAAGGAVITGLLNRPALVPEGLINVLVLSLLLALYQTSNALLAESGITAAIVAGFVTGNRRSEASRELREFKEQLTTMLLGLLFVLLAADVRMAEVSALGLPGLLVAGLLMFVVRPLNVLACTAGSGLTWRDKAFLSWVAPRGIVAAVVATLFQNRLAAAGFDGGGDLRALVFLVIAATVVFQGATAGLMARALGVRRPSGEGYALFGANPLALQMAEALRDLDAPPVVVDGDAERCRQAEARGFRTLFGNALEERIWLHAALDSRRGAITLFLDEALNQLFARRVRRELRGLPVTVAVQVGNGGVVPHMVREIGAHVLFGDEVDLELWNVRARRETAVRERWRRVRGGDDAGLVQAALPLLAIRDGQGHPVHDGTRLDVGAEAIWLTADDQGARRLRDAGWEPVSRAAEAMTNGREVPA
ncbi:MAG TPA: cation:proton antiporter [Candidatus Krumholzibacteria bacterium]|nr:cation:proton antiporter [Candidatus Krumholzibacteria bacterium]HRX52100.1 cation:proton antiporter [Candidatus Krumholzibacteria bacterium]